MSAAAASAPFPSPSPQDPPAATAAAAADACAPQPGGCGLASIVWADPVRAQAFERWLQPLAQAEALDLATLAPASADASFRRYFRLHGADGRSAIVMDAPPPQEDVRPFVDLAARLAAADLRAPRVRAADTALGFVLLDDLGRTLYLAELQAAQQAGDSARADAHLRELVSTLVRWQQRVPGQGLPVYDQALLQRELQLFPDWCVQREYGQVWTEAQQATWQRICRLLVDSALAQPRVVVHRDWMPRNLMLGSAGPGILDFQDAVVGPVTYDIASLLRDAFISWDEAQELDWAVRWWQQARAAGLLTDPASGQPHPMAGDFGECWRALEWMGLQRHLKVLGIFCRLKHRDGKPAYAADLPRFFAYATRVALRYVELKPLVTLLEPLAGPLTQTGYALR